MANRFNVLDFPPIRVSNAGAAVDRTLIYVGSVVGPASYSAGGIPVDLSSVFSTLTAVELTRVYTTATKAITGVGHAQIVEAGTDLFTSAKFRVYVFGFSANVVTCTGSLANVNGTETGVAASCGAVGCTGAHPNSVIAQRTSMLHGSGAAKATAMLDTEIAAATNLSTITFEYRAIGTAI